MLLSCARDSQIQDEMNDYRNTLEQVSGIALETELHTLDRAALAPPKRRDIYLEPPDGSINFREFFSLSGCKLNRLVGQHNSLLHKHQDAVENLFYELEFIKLAQECVNDNRDSEDEIYLRLEALSEAKAKSIARAFFNALFASKEFQKFTSPYGQLIKVGTEIDNSALSSAMEFFDQFGGQVLALESGAELKDFTFNEQRATFDIALGELSKSQLAGKIIALLALYTQELEFLNSAVAKKTDNTDFCSQDLTVLQKNFAAFYGQQYNAIAENLKKLQVFEKLLDRGRPASDTYLKKFWQPRWEYKENAQPADKSALFSQFAIAFQNHRNFIETQQKSCEG